MMDHKISYVEEDSQKTQSPEKTPVSVFGIIVVGLITGLMVGLYTPNATLTGFFIGFLAGASITAVLSLAANRATVK